jgi:putative ABC transport system permease protein
MGAVTRAAAAGLRRRRLQSVVLGVVLLLSSAAATLALAILVESRAPFDAAFTAANGAHLVIDFHPVDDPAILAATATSPGVTGSVGPYEFTRGMVGDPKSRIAAGLELAGRSDPDTVVDRITVLAGRWWRGPGEVVLGQSTAHLLDKAVGDTIEVYPQPVDIQKGPGIGSPTLPKPRTEAIVGVAQSVSTPDVAAWLAPEELSGLDPSSPLDWQMLYRVEPAATAAELSVAAAQITDGLPANTVAATATYLDVKTGVDRQADLYVPVLLAFAIFALLAAAFTIANVVSGVVIAGTRNIGIMKAIGFTPGNVAAVLLVQVLAPAALGSLLGVVLGTIASQPILRNTAESFGLPAVASASVPVVGGVWLVTMATAAIAAALPALGAARLNAVTAMTRGTTGSRSPDGGRLRRAGMGLRAGLPVRLGVGASLAHPGRATMTLGALVVGVAAVTLSIGLNASLLRVMNDLGRGEASPVRAELQDPSTDGAAVTAQIGAHPDTGQVIALATAEATAPGLGPVSFVGYEGDASWVGYALVRGRWFTGPGEAVAPSAVFRSTGLHLGDSLMLDAGGRKVSVTLVGEIFDTAEGSTRDHGVVRGAWADLSTLDPTAAPTGWELRPRVGVDARSYAGEIRSTVPGIDVEFTGDRRIDESFALFLSVVGLLGIVLILISLGGVFNTVLLETRQRTQELAVLKAIGLSPRSVMTMVLSSIVPIGVVAGLIGVPIGIVAQHAVLTYMGNVAANTDIPPAIFDVFPNAALVGLALTGLAIAVIGAWLPAVRAARAPIASILQAE